MPKLSIIIPIFNTSILLRRCLDCICNQTLRDIEIICIDDGSTDSSPHILTEYAIDDPRIFVISLTQNKGAAIARNIGISSASGDFIGFIDSDDTVDYDFFEKLYNKSQITQNLIVKGNLKIHSLTNEWIDPQINKKIHINKGYFLSNFGTAIYNRNYILENNLYFPNIPNGEDLAFIVKTISCGAELDIVDDTYYYYWHRPNSSSQRPITSQTINSMAKYIYNAIDFINKKNYDVKIYTIHFFKFIEDCFMLISLCQDKEAKKVCSKLIGYIYDKNKHQDELDALILNKDQFLLYPIQNKYYDILENWNNMTQFQKLRVKLNTKRHF